MELQTSLRDSKEEAVRLREATDQQLEEANARWDNERRKMSQHADEAIRVSVASHLTVSHLSNCDMEISISPSHIIKTKIPACKLAASDSHSAALVCVHTLGILQIRLHIHLCYISNPAFHSEK